MLQQELKNVKSQVDAFLKEFFEKKKKGIGKVHEEVKKMIDDIEDVTLRGGDRFRPFMVWLGACAANSKFEIRNSKQKNENIRTNRNLLKLMCSVELSHAFALIHDDIIDKAEKRRGGKTIKPDEKAILAGDLCFVFAEELLNGCNLEVKKEYDVLCEEVIAGELFDVLFARKSWLIPNLKHDIKLIHEYKTARYTFVRPFMIGYKFSIGDDLLVVPHTDRPGLPAVASAKAGGLSLQNILINIGLAFQIKDDFLDLYGDSRLGKTIGGDLKEGNLTVFHEKLVENKNNFDFQKYTRIWHNNNITKEEIKWVRNQIEKLGIKTEVEEEMQKFVNSAKKEIEKIDINPNVKTLLVEMAEFVVNREY